MMDESVHEKMTEDQIKTLRSSNVLVAGAGVVKAGLDYYSICS